MLPVALTKSLTAASANCIAQSQSLAAAGNAILNGTSVVSVGNGPYGASVTQAVLDTSRRIAIASAGNDSGITAHLYGLTHNGQAINEVLPLTNAGTAVSALDYKNLKVATFSGATASTFTIGTNGTGSTHWIVPNYDMGAFNLELTTQLTGSVTYNTETTGTPNYFDPPKATSLTTPQPAVNQNIVNSTTAEAVNLTTPITGYRWTITAGQGTLAAQGVQSGITDT